MFIPHEIAVIGAMINKKTKNISYHDVNAYIKRRQFNIELEEPFDRFDFITATDTGFKIDKIPPMQPSMIQFLAQ